MSKKRRTFTAQFKFETVMDVLRGEKSVAHICRERGYCPHKQLIIGT
jgi:transposase-like protein